MTRLACFCFVELDLGVLYPQSFSIAMFCPAQLFLLAFRLSTFDFAWLCLAHVYSAELYLAEGGKILFGPALSGSVLSGNVWFHMFVRRSSLFGIVVVDIALCA